MTPNQESTPSTAQPTTPAQTTPPANGTPSETTPSTNNTTNGATPPVNTGPNPQTLLKKRNHHIWLAIGLILICIIIPIWAFFALIPSIFKPFKNNTNEMNTYEELISYADDLDVVVYNGGQNQFTKLAGHYDVVSHEVDTDDKNNQKQRVVTLKLKDSDYTFKVTSSLSKCLISIDTSCGKYAYDITTNAPSTYEYYILTQYNQKIGYDTRYNTHRGTANPNDMLNAFKISSKSTLDFVIGYVNGLMDYYDRLPYKGIYSSETTHNINDLTLCGILFNFPPNGTQTSSHLVWIYLTLNSGNKYTIRFPSDYKYPNATLETFLNDYIASNNIILEL